MCGPALAPVLIGATAAIGATSSIMSGLAARQQGKYEAPVERRNASLVDAQAQASVEQGRIAQAQLARRYAQLKGSQVAAMAANGVDLGFGSALRVQEDTSQLYAEDATALDRNQRNDLRGYDFSAANARSAAQAAKMRGQAGMTAGYSERRALFWAPPRNTRNFRQSVNNGARAHSDRQPRPG